MKRFKFLQTLQGSLLLHELSFVFLILITASVGIVWAFAWQHSSEESIRLSTMNTHMQSIRGELYRQLKEVFDASFLQDSDAADEYYEYKQQINSNLVALYELANAQQEHEAIKQVANMYERFYQQTSQLLAAGSLSPQQRYLLDKQLEQLTFSQLEIAFNNFEQLLKRKQARLASNQSKWVNYIIWLAPLPVILSISLLIIARRFVKRNVINPLSRVIDGAKQISKGDFNRQLDETGVEDLQKLAEAINTMAEELASNRDILIETKKQAAMGELVPIVAHNIRNPLAGIRAAAQVTMDDELSDATNDALKDIITAVDRLERWVTSLLTYLHPLKPHFVESDLIKIADDALSLMQHQLAEKNIRIVKNGWLDHAKSIAVDVNLLEQTMCNLLQNAIEAAPQQSTITLGYEQHQSVVRLQLDDEGAGIKFNPIVEQAIDDETKQLGCGLGIPFAMKVIKQHDGTLSYKALPDKGTRVIIELPLHQAHLLGA